VIVKYSADSNVLNSTLFLSLKHSGFGRLYLIQNRPSGKRPRDASGSNDQSGMEAGITCMGID